MLKDGTYAAWFATPAGQGVGTIHIAAGHVSGRDDILSYAGTYKTKDDFFTAVIRTKRHSPGHQTVFGIDDLTLRIEGTCVDAIARCTGHADEIPNMLFSATLIRSRPEHPKPRDEPSPDDFHPEKLPSLPSR